MNCAEIEALLCEYVEGRLGSHERAQVEEHLRECPSCAELAREGAAALTFMARTEPVEVPPSLVTRVVFELGEAMRADKKRRGLGGVLGDLLAPLVQPRFAMGMAMTILSFSMLARLAGLELRQVRPADLHPVKVWLGVEDRIYRGWDRAVKFYDNLQMLYELRSRLQQIAEEESQPKPAEPSKGEVQRQGAERK